MVANGEGREYWGAGVDSDIIIASIKALLSALNRSCFARQT
jgi:2-isopropylmalate synthase